jgi:hypothetical protein
MTQEQLIKASEAEKQSLKADEEQRLEKGKKDKEAR